MNMNLDLTFTQKWIFNEFIIFDKMMKMRSQKLSYLEKKVQRSQTEITII